MKPAPRKRYEVALSRTVEDSLVAWVTVEARTPDAAARLAMRVSDNDDGELWCAAKLYIGGSGPVEVDEVKDITTEPKP